jgi:hypothetical protein
VILDTLVADPGATLLVLLVAGHCIADFGPRIRGTAGVGPPAGVLVVHVGLVVAIHMIVALPLFGLELIVAILGIGLLHALVDGLKTRVSRLDRESATVLILDQAAHLVVIVAAWALLIESTGAQVLVVPTSWLRPWVTASVVVAAFAANATGGSVLVRIVLGPLDRSATDRADSGHAGAGRLIGILERTLTLILILAGEWAAMALLATAKSVARFDDLKDREFAEYYLVGTLTSLLVAILIGLALRVLGLGF